jgi:hypothetical protein
MLRSFIVLGVVVVVACPFRAAPASAKEDCKQGTSDYWQCVLHITSPSSLRFKIMKSLDIDKSKSLDLPSLRYEINPPGSPKKYTDSQVQQTLKSLESKGLITVDPQLLKNKQGTIAVNPKYR